MAIRKLVEIPEYRDACEKLAELRVTESEVAREERELRAALSNASDMDSEVDALLHDMPVATSVATREKHAQVVHQYRVVEAAIERQRKVVESARCAASEQVRADAMPKYRAIVKRTAHILASLREVAVEERELREALRSDGVSLTNAFILPFLEVGEPAASGGTRYDAIANWERQAKAAGML